MYAYHRRYGGLALLSAGVAALLLGTGLTFLVERYISPDHVVEARTRALLWTLRVRLIALGAGALLVEGALRRASLQERLRRLNAHPRSWCVIAGAIAAYAAVGLYVDPYLLSDLSPTPDAAEYAASARRLMTTWSYTIPVGEKSFPPRYSFGYPLLIVPFYRVFGAQLSNAVFCSLVMVALASAVVYRTAELVWGRTAGVVAALLTLSSQAVIDASRSVMSESGAMLVTALSAWLLVWLVERKRPAWMWSLLGLCIGAGAVVRFSNVLLLAPAAAILLLRGMNRDGQDMQNRSIQGLRSGRILQLLFIPVRVIRRSVAQLSHRERIWCLTCLCAGCGIAIAPLLIYQAKTFGGVLRTGYSFWVPYYYDSPRNAFRISYAFQKPAMGGSGSGIPNLTFYGGQLAGYGRHYYAIPTAVFVALGAMVSLRGNRNAGRGRPEDGSGTTRMNDGPQVLLPALPILGWFVVGATAVTALFYTVYFVADQRFLTPSIPLLMLMAGIGIAAKVKLRPSGWRKGSTILCNILFLWGIIESLVSFGGGYTVDIPRRYEIARLISRRTEANAVVVSGIDPMFLSETAGREAIPVSRSVEYASKIILPKPIREPVPGDVADDPVRYAEWALARGAKQAVEWTAADSPGRIAGFLEEGRPVYCDNYDLRGNDSLLWARFRFDPVDSVAGVKLFRLRMP